MNETIPFIDELFVNYYGHLVRLFIKPTTKLLEHFEIIYQKHLFNSQKNAFECIEEAKINCNEIIRNGEIKNFAKSRVDSSRIDVWVFVVKNEKQFYNLISINPDCYPKVFHAHNALSKLQIQNVNCLFAIQQKNIIYSVSLSIQNRLVFDLFFSQDKNDLSSFKSIQIAIPNELLKIESYECAFIHCFHTKAIAYNVVVLKVSPSVTIDSLVTFLVWFENGKLLIEKLNNEYLFGEFCSFNYEFHNLNGYFHLKNIHCFDLALKVFSIGGKCLINTYSSYETRSRILYLSNGRLINEVISNDEYIMVRPMKINVSLLNSDEHFPDSLIFVTKLKANENKKEYKFQFFKDTNTESLFKVIHEIESVKNILYDEFIIDCNCCCASNQLVVINANNEWIVEHDIKVKCNEEDSSLSKNGDAPKTISDNFKHGLKAPIFQQIKKLLEAKIDEASILTHKILKEKKYKNYLINSLINLHFNNFVIRNEFLSLINIYSRSKFDLLDKRLKFENSIKNLSSCTVVKKWSCFLDDKLLLNFIFKMDKQ